MFLLVLTPFQLLRQTGSAAAAAAVQPDTFPAAGTHFAAAAQRDTAVAAAAQADTFAAAGTRSKRPVLSGVLMPCALSTATMTAAVTSAGQEVVTERLGGVQG